MKCTFYRPADVNEPEYRAIIEKLRADLVELETQPTDKQEVFDYVKALCSNARPLQHDPGMFFLGFGDPNEMPGDARVAYFYHPTYLATAFLIKAVLLYPEMLDEDKTVAVKGSVNPRELRTDLRLLMNGCTGRSFEGDCVLPLKKCIGIFAEAGTEAFLEKYPAFNPKFKRLFERRKAMVERGERPAREAWYGTAE